MTRTSKSHESFGEVEITSIHRFKDIIKIAAATGVDDCSEGKHLLWQANLFQIPMSINTNPGVSDINGFASSPSLAISKPISSTAGVQTLLDKAVDESLVIILSPRVGFFRRSRTIKGKREPLSCKEYLNDFEKNLSNLREALEELKQHRNDVKRKIELAERRHMKRTDTVQGWLTRVSVIEAEVNELLSDCGKETESRCWGCFCRNCSSRYSLGRRTFEKIDEVWALKNSGQFDEVATKQVPSLLDRLTGSRPVGLQATFEKVWSCLEKEHVGIIGLYGIGGVGKTTLLDHINYALSESTLSFDHVICVVVSRNSSIEQIQVVIGRNIGLFDALWKEKNPEEKCIDIYNSLKLKKFVLLLDDVWERFDMQKVGIPVPDAHNKSKIMFTTRSEMVCGYVGAQVKIRMECLGWDDAWNLFKKEVGEDTINSDAKIPQLAEVLAKECGGLPLALVTIGRTMSCKRTPEEWNYAIDVLQRTAAEFSGMGDEVFPLLKLSYDNLPGPLLKSCFLYCSLFPEDFPINKNELVDYWISEGFLEEFDDISGAQNQVYHLVGILVNAGLLEEVEKYTVKMHDVIRDMALWIASDCGKVKDKYLVHARSKLIEAPVDRKWKGVERVSLMDNSIEKLTGKPSCPNLLTLFLNRNQLKMISDGFFQSMHNLRVLNLSRNNNLTDLPSEIFGLVNLKYLDLSETSIKNLPASFAQLKLLKCLNLSYMKMLEKIPNNVIRSFSMLLVLRMFACGSSDQLVEGSVLSGGNEDLVEELGCLEDLKSLSITLNSVNSLQKFLNSDRLQSCTQELTLQFCQDSVSLDILSLETMKALDSLDISYCHKLEKLTLREGHEIIGRERFQNLRILNIYDCSRLADLTWLVYVPNLEILVVQKCNRLEAIMQSQEGHRAFQVAENFYPFSCLTTLVLWNLPELKSIFGSALPFPCLREIRVNYCPKLKKLPLNSQTTKNHIYEIEGTEEWWNALEWDDEDTWTTFIRFFKAREARAPTRYLRILCELVTVLLLAIVAGGLVSYVTSCERIKNSIDGVIFPSFAGAAPVWYLHDMLHLVVLFAVCLHPACYGEFELTQLGAAIGISLSCCHHCLFLGGVACDRILRSCLWRRTLLLSSDKQKFNSGKVNLFLLLFEELQVRVPAIQGKEVADLKSNGRIDEVVDMLTSLGDERPWPSQPALDLESAFNAVWMF
ncbi:Leucine-rich repeat [Dillenia turbinata]|uniref:Leucine-rich repeat n=1 Tax=Dillenia turbinata TaxID=194707 RepID=A0AAN8UGE4_9MAGN